MAAIRKKIGKKIRFEVFKRDSFTCQYCGAAPPAVVLEVDHIEPVSEGGSNDAHNLITACFDCNRGKGSTSLSVVPSSLVEQAEIAAERELQITEYRKLIASRKRRETRDIKAVEKALQTHFPGCWLSEQSQQSIRLQFLPKLDASVVVDNMHRACLKRSDNPPAAFKYFCGICWSMIRDNENA